VVNSVNGKKKKKKRKLEKVQSISDSPICVTIDDNGTYSNFLCIAIRVLNFLRAYNFYCIIACNVTENYKCLFGLFYLKYNLDWQMLVWP
jgi:hypothetical protein